MVRKSRVELIYHAVFIAGVILLVTYFWTLSVITATYGVIELILYGSGVLLILLTFSLAFSTTRIGRTMLTVGSGAFTGVHGYILVTEYAVGQTGTVLFAWLMLGLLFSFSAFFWLRELRRSTVRDL